MKVCKNATTKQRKQKKKHTKPKKKLYQCHATWRARRQRRAGPVNGSRGCESLGWQLIASHTWLLSQGVRGSRDDLPQSNNQEHTATVTQSVPRRLRHPILWRFQLPTYCHLPLHSLWQNLRRIQFYVVGVCFFFSIPYSRPSAGIGITHLTMRKTPVNWDRVGVCLSWLRAKPPAGEVMT